MQLEEFIALGCINCGMHSFQSTGPIEHDGATEIECESCGAGFKREFWSELDSIQHETLRNNAEGLETPVQRTTYYENAEQFIDQFEKATTPGPDINDS